MGAIFTGSLFGFFSCYVTIFSCFARHWIGVVAFFAGTVFAITTYFFGNTVAVRSWGAVHAVGIPIDVFEFFASDCYWCGAIVFARVFV